VLKRPRRTYENLSISALDLFATSLGVFVLIAIILFPFYLKQPAMDESLYKAQKALAAAKAAKQEAAREADAAMVKKDKAEAGRKRASRMQKDSEAENAKAQKALLEASARASDAGKKKGEMEAQLANLPFSALDLVFVMDATGSMSEEIRDVQQNLISIVRILHRLASSLNVGFVAFKDRQDRYLTKVFPLSPMEGVNLSKIQAFVESLVAKGGGDVPEPVGAALREAVNMPWRDDVRGRIVVIGDAPSHAKDWNDALNLAADFIAKAPGAGKRRAVSTIYTGRPGAFIGEKFKGRDFYKQLAAAGQGDFVTHRGRMIESVMLSVIESSAAQQEAK